MKEKIKNINMSSFVAILKASLIGVIVSILLVLLFAFVLKFVDLSSGTIAIVDQIIKILSVFVAVLLFNKNNEGNLLLKGIIVGAVYSILTFIVFSILNGGFNIGFGIFTDVVFSALTGGISAILINILKHK